MLFWLLLFAALVALGWLAFKTPSNSANWQTQFKVLPTVSLEGDTVSINNVRDFRYNSNDTIAEVTYLDQRYQLSEFKTAWYGISHFGGNGLAHVFMSFEFANDQFLVVSIEARLREEDVEGYNPIKGLFRAYTKTIVLATERDVIGLRTHIRNERVLLYRLDVPELYSKTLLLNFLRQAQVLNRKPTFYNTVIDNCLTGLLAQSDQFRNFSAWLDTRILLPGNSDEIAYELDFIDSSKALEQAREMASIDPSRFSIDDDNFSQRIRE